MSSSRRRRSVAALVPGVLLAGLVVPVPLGGQEGAGLTLPPVEVTEAPGGAEAVLAQADRLFLGGPGTEAPRASLDVLEAYLGRRPSDPEARWRAARAALALGMLDEGEDVRLAWMERSVEHAERAAAEAPEDVPARYWLVATRGWLSLSVADGGRVAELGRQVWEDGHWILERAPDHAGAHHALGTLHYEVQKLSWVERMFGRYVLGVDFLGWVSWEDAFRHLERAAELEPEMIRFHLDLGRAYLEEDRREEAAAAFHRALDIEPRFPPDRAFQERARGYLREIG